MVLHSRFDLLGVSDLNGLMLYCDTTGMAYKRTNCSFINEIFTDILSRRGAPRLFTAEEARGLFPSQTIPDSSLYCARAIMQLYPLSAVGVIFCRGQLTNITDVFDANRLFDTQQLSILSDEGALYYGTRPRAFHRGVVLPAGQSADRPHGLGRPNRLANFFDWPTGMLPVSAPPLAVCTLISSSRWC